MDYCRLFADGHSLFQTGRYAESLEVLGRGARLSSDPMFERIYGRRADKKRRLYNGRLECEFMVFGPR